MIQEGPQGVATPAPNLPVPGMKCEAALLRAGAAVFHQALVAGPALPREDLHQDAGVNVQKQRAAYTCSPFTTL
jgi:hypothetical protein